MSDEDAFQAALDADPGDGLLRRVFADWLEERGDPRAEGYRVLGELGLRPEITAVRVVWLADRLGRGRTPAGHLPSDWYDRLTGRPYKGRHLRSQWAAIRNTDSFRVWLDPERGYGTRRAAEDDAARAWLSLTAAERAAVLGEGVRA